MKKLFILVFLLLMFSVIIILANARTENVSFDYQHTKAICSGNSCQDFLITCNNKELVKMTPLTGLVTFSDSWKDPRTEEEKELC